MKDKIALLIGRFQPFHFGHLYLIKQALKKADKLVIGIGSSNITDVNNPLDWRSREKILKAVFYKEKIEDKVIKIVPLDDFFNDKKWFDNVAKLIGKFNLVVGNNDWVNRIMESGGYKILTVPYFKRYLYEGEKIRKLLVDGGKWQDRVPSYLVKYIEEIMPKQNFDNVVIGGTFDHFHKGHRKLIDKAYLVGKKVIIGITTEKMYKHKLYSKLIEDYETRKKSVEAYLKSKNWLGKTKILEIENMYGSTLKDPSIKAIVVSKATSRNARDINDMRKKKGYDPMKIVLIDDVLANDGKLITSERIRAGEIDRRGEVYSNLFKSSLSLPDQLREKLRFPLGNVCKNTKELVAVLKKNKPTMVLSVGDIVTAELKKAKMIPDIAIIDLKSRRINLEVTDKKRVKKYKNEAGTINFESASVVNKAIEKHLTGKKSQTIVIQGEEDLLTLPAVLLAPLGSIICYGHWELGAIAVPATEEIKDNIAQIIRLFM